jgi:drug/metabolite transporter (DMT)-like permease
MALAGSYVALSKLLLLAFPVFLLAWLRFGIGAVAMMRWANRAPGEPALDGRTHRLLFFESLLGNFLFSICMLFGMRLTSALAAGVILAALPATVALLSRAFLGERLEPRVLLSIACAVVGVAMVSLLQQGTSVPTIVDHDEANPSAMSNAWLGNLLLVGAVICEASYVVIGKRLTASVSPKRIAAIVNLWGLALMTPLGLWQASSFAFGAVPQGTWALLLFYALAASVWSVWLWMTGLLRVEASRAGVFSVMLPISAAVVGVLVLGERVGTAQSIAFGVALMGLLLATWPTRPHALNRP